jgi:hypothetical protein
MPVPAEILALIERPDYNETQVRVEFINPLSKSSTDLYLFSLAFKLQ